MTDPVAWLQATSHARGIGYLSPAVGGGTWVARARCLRDMAFPSKVVLAGSWPTATRGRSRLAMAYAGRLGLILTRLPPLLVAWHGARAAVRIRRPGAAVISAAWTLRTWWRVHRQLAQRRLAGPQRSLAPPIAAGSVHWGRAARLVLACCRSTCLETALVRQAVAAAHAWLDGDRVDPAFEELCRYPGGPDPG